MLQIQGPASKFCDGMSRRGFFQVGACALGAASFSLADLYRAEAQSAQPTRQRSLINIFLAGGPPHQDMWDLKPDAPSEIRGEFNPIHTNVAGIQIGEVFTRMAQRMDKCAIIRSVVGAEGRHDGFQCMTGFPTSSLAPLGGRPSFGAVVSKIQGAVDPSVPPFVGLTAPTQHKPWSDVGGFGFLGPSYAPFRPDGPGLANLRLNGLSTTELGNRRRLMDSFDTYRRDVDASGIGQGLDAAQQRALGVLTSSRLLDALDLSRETNRVRERYGDGRPYQYQYDGAPTVNDQLLLARRLIEAGVRVVSLSYGRWDSHGKNFDLVRDHGSKLDQCLSALIDDLETRGMLDDVTIAVWGEFGRTPRINANAGRDHWPQVAAALLAGGGMKTGKVIGATNRLGEYAANRPVHFSEIAATIYHNLGINPQSATVSDPSGRPQHVTDGAVMHELV